MRLAFDGTINTADIRTLEKVACRQPISYRSAPYQTPVSPCTNWVTVNSDAAVQVDVTVPGNINKVTYPQLKVLSCGHAGTLALIRMRYPTGVATATSIKVFGFDGSYIENNSQPESETLASNVRPRPELLPDVDGNLELVFTPDFVNDPDDADGFSYTLSTKVDFHGNLFLLFPATQAGGQGTIEARIV